jgi:hypothetical protein
MVEGGFAVHLNAEVSWSLAGPLLSQRAYLVGNAVEGADERAERDNRVDAPNRIGVARRTLFENKLRSGAQ